MKVSDFANTVESNGHELPLAFVYDDNAYYFDVNCYDDAQNTVVVRFDKKEIRGIEANKMLVDAIKTYGKNRGRVWIAGWFRDCVAYELENSQE